jgi:hypothetical protein
MGGHVDLNGNITLTDKPCLPFGCEDVKSVFEMLDLSVAAAVPVIVFDLDQRPVARAGDASPSCGQHG